MNFNNPNFMGILNVELKIFKNIININGNQEYDISLEIVNINNDNLISKINNDFKILDIIRNTNRLQQYKNLIDENEKLIAESVHRKKEDIIEVASYMIQKEKEIEDYKIKITNLIKQKIPTIKEISINDNDFNDMKQDEIPDNDIENQNKIPDIDIKQNEIPNNIIENQNEIKNLIVNIENSINNIEASMINFKQIETQTNMNIDGNIPVSSINNEISNIIDKNTQTDIIENIDINTQTDIIENDIKEDRSDIELIDYFLDKNKDYYLEYLNIENSPSENKHINIELKYKNLSCIIEMKKNKKNIGPNEVDKFLKKYIKDNKYNCGLYISMESEFTKNSNIVDFEINIINKKPIIFISNVNNNKNKIDYAIKLLNYITNYKNINNYNENEIDCYVSHINNYYNYMVDNIVDYDNRINHSKEKINQLTIKRNNCLNNLNSLEKIPTLQFGSNINEEVEINEENEVNNINEERNNLEVDINEEENKKETFHEEYNEERKDIENGESKYMAKEDTFNEEIISEGSNGDSEDSNGDSEGSGDNNDYVKIGLKSLVNIVDEFKSTNQKNKINKRK